MRIKLLVILSDDITRKIEDIDESGSYYDPSKVLWDERVDGSLPAISDLQGTIRNGSALEFSQAQKDSYTVFKDAQDAIDNKASSIESKKEKILQGQEVIALMSHLNEERAITVADSQALLGDASVQSAVGALQVGALESAKAVIEVMDISGLVVTEADRTEIVAKLDEFIGA